MILYLACYDGDQLKQWMQYIKKAMQFHEWLTNLKAFLEEDQEKLTEKYSTKLGEMVQFVEQYSSIEKVNIDFVDKEKAASRDKKMNVLKQQEIDN